MLVAETGRTVHVDVLVATPCRSRSRLAALAVPDHVELRYAGWPELILGRAREVELATDVLLSGREGPCALFVEGDPGIGKTTLFDAVVTGARERGFKVLRCRPSQSEVRLPHAGIIEALDGVPTRLVDGLPAPQRRALRVALRWDEPERRPTDSRTVAAAVATLMRSKAESEPVLVAVDDLHWLDDASANAFEYALRRLEGLPVSVIAASRSAEGSRPRPMERAVSPERVRRMSLGPLDDEALRSLLTARLGLDVTPAVARRVAGAAGGNPFLALEIGRAIQDHGVPRPDEPLPIPDDVRQMVSSRLLELPSDTRSALLEIAAGARHAPDAVVLAPAEHAGIVRTAADGSVDFVHPLYESAIYESAPAAERRAVHARLAQQVDTPEVSARHVALAAEGPAEQVAGVVAAAAAAAFVRGAVDVAADLYERAWRLTPGDQDEIATERALAAAEGYFVAGQVSEGDRVLNDLLPHLEGHARGRALRIQGESRLWAAAMPEAIGAFEESLACLEDDPKSAAAAHLALAFAHFQTGVDPQSVGRHAAMALEKAEAVGAGSPLAESLAVKAMVDWLFGLGRDDAALERAEALFEPTGFTPVQLRPSTIRATIQGYTGQIADAIDHFEREYEQCLLHGAIADVVYLGVHLTTLSDWHGRPDRSRHFAGETQRICEELSGGFSVAAGLLAQVTVAATDGDVATARQRGAEALQWCAEKGTWNVSIWIAGALARMELSLGDPEAALGWLGPVVSGVPVLQMPDPAAVFFVPDAIEAMILIGDAAGAQGLLDPFEQKSVELGRTWTLATARRCRALLLASQGDVEGAAIEAAAAVEGLASEGYVIELGRAHLVLGQIERRRRKRAAARAGLGEALRIFRAAGATLWAARAEDMLGTAWSPRSDDGLTAAEQRVAELAAAGLTNPEIAAQVFVSRRTVEATLSRVYRKLDVRSRTELARRFAADGDAGD
jgi:DNA-binding CsgD family transcriptional regulator